MSERAPWALAHPLSAPPLPASGIRRLWIRLSYSLRSCRGCRGSLDEVKAQVPTNPAGGTLAVYLGLGALRLSCSARIHSCGLRVLEPTWSTLGPRKIGAKLRLRDPGSQAPVHAPDLEALAREVEGRAAVSEVLRARLGRARPSLSEAEADYLDRALSLIESGALSERIAARLRPHPGDDDALTGVARRTPIDLADCLLDHEPWGGGGLKSLKPLKPGP